MSELKRVLVLGATGAVGQALLNQLEKQPQIQEIAVITRRPLSQSEKTSKVREYLMNYGELDADSECFRCDAVFCALGTTRKKAGSDENFIKIDHDYSLEAAKIARKRSVPHFLIVSAHGADPESRFFYNRLKGMIERDLIALKFPKLTIVRPSLLIRNTGDWRPVEKIAQVLALYLPKKWRSVSTEAVAISLMRSYQKIFDGLHIIRNQDIFLD